MVGIDLSAVSAWIEDNLLLDTVKVTKPGTGQPVFNDTTGEYDYPAPVTVYEGPGAVQRGGSSGDVTIVPAAQQPWVDEPSSRYKLLTPLAAPVPARDHIVTVVAVHEGGDTALIGRRWRCQDVGDAGTVAAVRVTPLDQMQQTGGEA